MEYKVGDLVRVKQLTPWEKIDNMKMTPGMASLSGMIGILDKVDWDDTVQIIFTPESRWGNEYWFPTGAIELVTIDEED